MSEGSTSASGNVGKPRAERARSFLIVSVQIEGGPDQALCLIDPQSLGVRNPTAAQVLHNRSPPHWAVTSMSAPAAAIGPLSPTTAAATGIVPNVRPLPATVGSKHVARNLSRLAMSMWSSRFPVIWPRWCCRTRSSSTISCFASSAETLLEVARNPQHLGAEIGFFSVLHTWSQKLETHPHVHCVVPAGGLSLDHAHWVSAPQRFFLPREVLRKVADEIGNFENWPRTQYSGYPAPVSRRATS